MKIKPFYIILILSILNSFLFLLSFIMMDSSRDMHQAINISTFTSFPLLGPDIGGFAHVGPIWYYFLALPFFSGSIAVVSLWVGFFSSLKFVLAFSLGKSILNEKFGILWVCALLLPGWQTFDSLMILHTNLVQTLTLLFLFALVKYHTLKQAKYFIFAALALSLAIHAHPSTLILSLVLPFFIYKERKVLKFNTLIIAFLIFILPFLPYFYDQFLNGFSDLKRLGNLSEFYQMRNHMAGNNNDGLSIFHRFPNFIMSLLYYGPLQIHHTIALNNSFMADLVLFCYLTLISISFIGMFVFMIKSKTNFYIIVRLLLIFILMCLMILSLRSFLPFYMVLVLVPVYTGIIAFGLWLTIQRFSSKFIFTITFLFFVFSLLPSLSIYYTYQNNQFEIHNTNEIESTPVFVNLKDMHGLDGLSTLNLSSFDQELCDEQFIHGPFTIVLDYTGGLPFHYFCPKHELNLGGVIKNDEKHIFIMHKSFWDKILIEPQSYVFNVFGYTHKFINHSQTKSWSFLPFDNYNYPPIRDFTSRTKTTLKYEFMTEGNTPIVITNIFPNFNLIKIENVSVNNLKVDPEIYNIGNWLYRCQTCQNSINNTWEITITSKNHQAIDINEILSSNNKSQH
jgi:hypothetical protein